MNNILITGGSSGLGFELAKLYSQKNHVIIVGRSINKLNIARESLRQLGGSCDSYVCDLSKVEDIHALTNTIEKKYQSLDTLINNAGVGYFGPLKDLTLSELNQMLDLNVKATILMTQSFLPLLRHQLINIISTAGLRGKVNETAYVASKFAVRGFTESLQKEYKDKLSITAVYMGGMNTAFWDNSDHISDKSRLKDPQTIALEIIKHQHQEEIIID